MGKISIVIMAILTGFLLTSSSIISQNYSQRQLVDSDTPIGMTASVLSWGWPFQYLIDDPNEPNYGSRGVEDKVLLVPFIIDWLVFMVLSLAVVGGIMCIGKMWPSSKSF